MLHASSTMRIFIIKTLSLQRDIMHCTEIVLILLQQKEKQIPALFDSLTTVETQTFTRKDYWFKYFSWQHST